MHINGVKAPMSNYHIGFWHSTMKVNVKHLWLKTTPVTVHRGSTLHGL